MDQLWRMIADERNDFADFLETLGPDQWDTPSLCTEWMVRDVAGHVIFVQTVSIAAFFGSLARSGFNFNRAMNREARERGKWAPDALMKELRQHAGDRSLPPGDKPAHMLGDTLVHHQDCRRPLALPRSVPGERVRAVLDGLHGSGPILGTILRHTRRMSGLKFVASDLDWSTGAGPEVRGPAEALLMTILGRAAALDDLEGDGITTLRSRV